MASVWDITRSPWAKMDHAAPWAVFSDNDVIANLILSGPFFVVGLLFWISGSRKAG